MHPLVEQSTSVSIVSDATSEPHVRTAFFLRPRAGAAVPAPPGGPGTVPTTPHGIEAEFKGWARVPGRWPEWVEKLRQRHEPLWRKLGIRDGILASTCRVMRGRDHERVLLQLAAFWNEDTGTFVFPWGAATLTLEDVAVLAGLPLFGFPVREPVSDRLEEDAAEIEIVRAVLNKSKARKAAYGAWVERFVDKKLEEAPPSAAGGGGDGEVSKLDIEHGAFLAMWLSLFILPGPPFDVVRREVFPLAARLARGESVALAPAALAAIYHDISELKRRIASGKVREPFVFSAPAHIVQLWVWEHFAQLSPEPAASSSADGDMPRAARWHEVEKRLSSKGIHKVFMSPEEFQWTPYGFRTLLVLELKGGFWCTATNEDLFSMVRCLHACELVGMNCIQQYNPHRVARQLGFDQDIPGKIPRASSSWEKAWETYYNMNGEITGFLFPRHKPGVTVQYAKWWKPYSSACLAKRKMEGTLAGSSGKKPRYIIEILSDDELNEETSKKAGTQQEPVRKK